MLYMFLRPGFVMFLDFPLRQGPCMGNLLIIQITQIGHPGFGVASLIQVSANVYPLQHGVQRIFQAHFIVVSRLLMAEDGLPLDQRFDALAKIPGGHARFAQQPAVPHLLQWVFLQQAQDLPFLIQLAPLRQLLQKRPGVLVVVLAEIPGLLGGAGVHFVVQEPGLEWALPADCGSPG